MAKLEKILESMDSFKINSEVALLENTDLTDLTRAQTRKEIHESFNFIKEELIKGGLLEETHALLANTWTQAIMEDIGLGMDYEPFQQAIINGKESLKAAIPTGEDVDKFAKNMYNNGKHLLNEYLPRYSSNDYENMKSSQEGLAKSLADSHRDYENMKSSQEGLAKSLADSHRDYENMKSSQEGLVKILNGSGAKIGTMVDGAMENNPLATSAGLIGAGAAAGYGTYKAGEKVKRALTGK